MKISVYIASSLDGFIARKDGSLDWLDRVGGFGEEDYGFKEFLNSVDAVILGRNTYDVAAKAPEEVWPYGEKRLIVLSSKLRSAKNFAEIFHGDVQELARKLRAEGISHVWIDGGETISQFLQVGLVDSIIISIIPVLLGSGVPLFRTIEKELSCRLRSAKPYPSGLVQVQYDLAKTSEVDRSLEEGQSALLDRLR